MHNVRARMKVLRYNQYHVETLSVSADQLHCGGKMLQLSTIHVPSSASA